MPSEFWSGQSFTSEVTVPCTAERTNILCSAALTRGGPGYRGDGEIRMIGVIKRISRGIKGGSGEILIYTLTYLTLIINHPHPKRLPPHTVFVG